MKKTLKEQLEELGARASGGLDEIRSASRKHSAALARRLDTNLQKRRVKFCARTAPPPVERDVKTLLDRAMRLAAPKLGLSLSALAIEDEQDASRVSLLLAGLARSGNRIAAMSEKAARHWSWWLQNHDPNELRDTKEFAENTIDEAS